MNHFGYPDQGRTSDDCRVLSRAVLLSIYRSPRARILAALIVWWAVVILTKEIL